MYYEIKCENLSPEKGDGFSGHRAGPGRKTEAGTDRLRQNPVVELLKSGGVDTVMVSDSMAPQQAAYYGALAKQPARC